MGEVIVIAGLPGCGKATHLCQMCRDGWMAFDDFKANAYNGSSAFHNSRKFRALVTALLDELRCVVADIDFCKTDSRTEAERVLRVEVPSVKLEWQFFVNDYQACERNIQRRNRLSLQTDLEKLREYAALYRIPARAQRVLPVGG